MLNTEDGTARCGFVMRREICTRYVNFRHKKVAIRRTNMDDLVSISVDDRDEVLG